MKFTGERYIPGSNSDKEISGLEHWQRYIAASHMVQGKRVLDIASGEGYGTSFLSNAAAHVYGVDISEEAIAHATQKYGSDKIEFLQGSVEKIPLPDHYVDVVVSFETIEHVDEDIQKAFLDEVRRVLTSDGFLLISCPNAPLSSERARELWGYENKFHIKEHSIQEFQEMLLQYFPAVKLLYQRVEDVIILSEEHPATLSVILSEDKTNDNAVDIIAVCGLQTIPSIQLMNTAVLDLHNSHMEAEKQLCNNYKRLSQKEAELIQKYKQVGELCEELNKRDEIFTQLNNYNQQIARDIANMREALAEKNDMILEKDNELVQKYKQVGELCEELTRRDDIFAQVNDYNGQMSIVAAKIKDELIKKNKVVAQQEAELALKDKVIAQRESELALKDKMIIQEKAEVLRIHQIYEQSTSWKITKPIRLIKNMVRNIKSR